jgi:hypothetical protein
VLPVFVIVPAVISFDGRITPIQSDSVPVPGVVCSDSMMSPLPSLSVRSEASPSPDRENGVFSCTTPAYRATPRMAASPRMRESTGAGVTTMNPFSTRASRMYLGAPLTRLMSNDPGRINFSVII